MSKFVDPEKPYIKEQPYNNNPEDKALSTKYFSPASEDFNSSLLKDAKTYNASDYIFNDRTTVVDDQETNEQTALSEVIKPQADNS